MRKERKHTAVQEPPALKQWEQEQSTERAGLLGVGGGSPHPGGGWGAAFKDNSMEIFQRGREWVSLDRQRSSHSFKLSSTNSALNCADSTSARALSQERRAARTAMQNLADTFAEQFLACADKALAEGVQHHWSWAQRGEACVRAIGLNSWPRRKSQQPFPEAGRPICKSWDPAVPLCYRRKQKLKGLGKNKES